MQTLTAFSAVYMTAVGEPWRAGGDGNSGLQWVQFAGTPGSLPGQDRHTLCEGPGGIVGHTVCAVSAQSAVAV